ncbi:hypothetical protein EFA69_11800 [Rufibacter immobilis]|uniref:Entericidin n=1 Tax=Rufibacter immobilis TaxID=1348778 RepID=A0A3M9MYC3_9BACT|nr:hypothetical protein [Rufibacter immobilis]RNI30175.1 hypothetical protein EFA69_11800 [Rufibacter immobilis]
MKNILPFFAACALLAGVACSTYTSTTDPNDKGSGTALTEEATTAAPAAEEAHSAAPAAMPTSTDSAAAPKAEAAAPTQEAAH